MPTRNRNRHLGLQTMAGAPLGNKNGTKERRLWADAVRRAVLRGDALNRLADKLIAEALDGDMAAMREIGDRLDGKPTVSVTGEGGGPVAISFTWRPPT